ncbi:unnamed protein product [Meloidogyne enterolobii]|uniref:Uncharacterized protein n=1 Tax=Meloidogyne enterolobii TaxID=390850 RepID=A0ACB0YVP3_MELEN
MVFGFFSFKRTRDFEKPDFIRIPCVSCLPGLKTRDRFGFKLGQHPKPSGRDRRGSGFVGVESSEIGSGDG